MPLSIFHLNRILILMIKINIKQFLFHMWKIRAEGYSTLIANQWFNVGLTPVAQQAMHMQRNVNHFLSSIALVQRCPDII